MSELPQNIPLQKLPVWGTIREAFVFSWDHRHVLWPWVIVGAMLTGLGGVAIELSYSENGEVFMGFPFFFTVILLTPIPGLLVFVLLAVYCHRTFLLYHGGKARRIKFFFIERDRKFFAWIFGIPLCVALVTLPGILGSIYIWYQLGVMYPEIFLDNTFVEDLLFNLSFTVPFYFLFSRWILVFPAIAIEQEATLSWSWRLTTGNSWRMFILVGFLPWTVGNLWYVLPFIGLSEFSVLSSFVTSFALFIFTPVEVAVISIAFRELTHWNSVPPLSQSA